MPNDRHRHDCARTGDISRLCAGEAGEILMLTMCVMHEQVNVE